jgi:hypothetical protein
LSILVNENVFWSYISYFAAEASLHLCLCSRYTKKQEPQFALLELRLSDYAVLNLLHKQVWIILIGKVKSACCTAKAFGGKLAVLGKQQVLWVHF